ncbi:MAG: DUF4097 domain-containing protein [Treponema sp.]|nr:DUF4097 domain-containing protein [Treponema sp.]
MKRASLILIGLLFYSAVAFSKGSLVSRDFYKADEISSIQTDLKHENIEIISESNEDITIDVICTKKNRVPEVSLNEGKLLIKSKLVTSFVNDYCKVIINLPVNMELEDFTALSSSGDLDIARLSTASFSVNSTSGNISCDSLICSGDINCKTTSGDIEIDRLKAENLTLKSTSGNIEVSECQALNITGDATSGKIKFNNTNCNSFILQNTSGGVELELENAPLEESLIEATSGDIELQIPEDQAFEIKAESFSGSFEDDFNDFSIKLNGPFRNKYNGGGVVIRLETTSGDINIDD